jgi:pyruvate dehydrogenase E1 component
LQHQDGSSHLAAAAIPNCRAYDPAFAYELAVIVDHGTRRMMGADADEFYYLTVMNETYAQPSMPVGIEDQIVRGMYRLEGQGAAPQVRLLGSGAILREVREAAGLLHADWQVASDVFSVTSYTELAREAREAERWSRLHPAQALRRSHVETCLEGSLPVVAASDYVRAVSQLVAPYVPGRFIALGTDGFGRSDTRGALRRFFEVDRHHIVLAALDALARDGKLPRATLAKAIERYGIDAGRSDPWTC